jgi:hypothetical protein
MAVLVMHAVFLPRLKYSCTTDAGGTNTLC